MTTPVRAALKTMTVAATWLAATAWAAPPPTMGEQLFTGATPLPARIWGHERDLPPDTARCSNCHARSVGPAASGPATPVGPVLSAASLTELRKRRGGPPSRFDEASFCRLLREGVDPASIVVPRVMPRYTLTDAQCQALWRHLSMGPK